MVFGHGGREKDGMGGVGGLLLGGKVGVVEGFGR